jgi:hypothetical protein
MSAGFLAFRLAITVVSVAHSAKFDAEGVSAPTNVNFRSSARPVRPGTN